MRNQDVLKAVETVGNGILKVIGTITIVGIGLVKSYYGTKCHTGYNGAVKAIMNSSMDSSDKAKAISILELNTRPELYSAVIKVVGTTLSSNDKLNLIIELSKKVEEA